jgi:hypothetical protein
VLCTSYLNIVQAVTEDRDDAVVHEIDHSRIKSVFTRFLSELLCLTFPAEYPILNDPVKNFIKVTKLKHSRGASEGQRHVYLAENFRRIVLQNPKHPAKNLAELDTVIWLAYS